MKLKGEDFSDNRYRKLSADIFSQNCIGKVKSSGFYEDLLIPKSSKEIFFFDRTKVSHNIIPRVITLSEFLELKPELVSNNSRRQILTITDSSVSFIEIDEQTEEWRYKFQHSDFYFDCSAKVKLEYDVPLTSDLEFEILRTAKKSTNYSY